MRLSFTCCGVQYSTTDPETYHNFTKYRVEKTKTKTHVGNQRVESETVYMYSCKQGCTKLRIHRFNKSKNRLETEQINDTFEAVEWLNKHYPHLQEVKIPQPQKKVPFAKRIDLAYGKKFSEYQDEDNNNILVQRGRLLNELDWSKNSQHFIETKTWVDKSLLCSKK